MSDSDFFPRKIGDWEREYLFTVLPVNKPGYKKYRELIDAMEVIGCGANGEYNLILGFPGDKPDPDIPPSAVFAAGTVQYGNGEVYIVVHEISENQIECDFSPGHIEQLPADENETGRWTYSDWVPGKSLYDGSLPREIHLIKNELVLCLSALHRRVWIYEKSSGVNHLIPATNFYESLIRLRGINNNVLALNTELLFKNESDYSDQDLGAAFLIYNRAWKKIEIDYSLFVEHSKNEKRGIFLNFFKRG